MRRGLIPVLILADLFRQAFVTASLDTAFDQSLQSAQSPSGGEKRLGVDVLNAVAASPSVTHILEWLAISLTPGLGPTKARKLVDTSAAPRRFSTLRSRSWKVRECRRFRRSRLPRESRRNWRGRRLLGLWLPK